MKLVTFYCRGYLSIGKVVGGTVVDLPASDARFPRTMRELLAGGPGLLRRARELDADQAVTYPLTDVRLEAPLQPGKFLAIGLNYSDHVAEAGKIGFTPPESQLWFNKQTSCVAGPFEPIHKPTVSDMMDYEGELGVVIGRRCHQVAVADARSVIAGYLVCNDVSVRDWQRRSPTMQLGKSFNTHGPIGPWIVTDDEVPDPHQLHLRTFVNGQLRQESSTEHMLHNIYQQIAYISTVMTLEPGDLISTGTPAGVGAAMKPPCFLQAGDVVRVEIAGIGHIENPVIAQPGPLAACA